MERGDYGSKDTFPIQAFDVHKVQSEKRNRYANGLIDA